MIFDTLIDYLRKFCFEKTCLKNKKKGSDRQFKDITQILRKKFKDSKIAQNRKQKTNNTQRLKERQKTTQKIKRNR